MKRIIRIYPNIAFADRIDADVQAGKTKKIKIVFIFNPLVKEKVLSGKVGIITAFSLS